jgi:pimeloyl-ACP methyl ester carboxylesterase
MPWLESASDLERARAERCVRVPSRLGRLFGIFTPPAPGAPPAGSCVVLLTRPRSHRNRMWVEAARRLAARGFACFRFDYHGAGDSEGESGFLDPSAPYREDVVAVIRHLRDSLGQRRFVLVGSCFDARTALAAFPDEGEAIEGLVFIAAPAMALEAQTRVNADRKDWAHVIRSLGNPENWQALGSAERWRYMATVVSRVARRSVAGEPANEPPLSPTFVEHFEALRRSRARALFLYGADDAEYPTFQVAERTVFADLDAETRKRFEIEVWPGRVHGFLEMERAREALARALAWIETLHPASSASAGDAARGSAAGGAAEATWTSS